MNIQATPLVVSCDRQLFDELLHEWSNSAPRLTFGLQVISANFSSDVETVSVHHPLTHDNVIKRVQRDSCTISEEG